MFRLIKPEKNERLQFSLCDCAVKQRSVILALHLKTTSKTKSSKLFKLGDTAKLEQVMKSAKIFEAIEGTSKTLNDDGPKPMFGEEKVNKIDSKPVFKRDSLFKDKQNECTRSQEPLMKNVQRKGNLATNVVIGRDHFSRKCRSKKRIRNFDSKFVANQNNVKQENYEPQTKLLKTDDTKTVKRVETQDSNFKDEYIFCIGDETTNEIKVKIDGVELTTDSGSKFNIVDS